MSDTAEHHHDSHPPKYYVKIWGFLLILLVISFVGPELGIKWLTLITAFGIALVKAGMVCAYFMHMNIEKKYVWYILTATLLLLLVMFTGLAPDIMKPTGQNWKNMYHEPTAEEWDEQQAHGHDDSHGAGHAEDTHSEAGH
jgi:caa(3)-type oxidase subunit IV